MIIAIGLSLLGILQQTAGAIIGYVAGRLHNDTPVLMTLAISFCALGLFLSYRLLVRRT